MADFRDDLEVVRTIRAAHSGAVAHSGDGRVLFVRHALAGELVRVALTSSSARFARGEAVEVLEASDDRVEAPCPYARPFGCGGCDLQHANDAAQRAWKGSILAEHLARLAGVHREIVVEAAPSAPRGSRTRLRCGVDGEGRLALRAAHSHDLVTLSACWIADPALAPAFAERWTDAHEVELRALGDEAVAVVALAPGGPFAVRGLDGSPRSANHPAHVRVGADSYVVSPRSFWQSHRDAPALLASAVGDLARVTPGDDVVDLYGGVGLFARPLARRVGASGRVTCVEVSTSSALDARTNTRDLPQVRVLEQRVSARTLDRVVAPGAVVVVDPPRRGLDKGVAARLAQRARRVVYVSCDAATFARDLSEFLERGFTLSSLCAYDLFPMTEHVEVVASLDSPS